MVVISKYHDVFAEGGESHYGVLQTYLLANLDLSLIEREIEKKFYSKNLGKRFHYRIALLLKLWAYMRKHKLTYRTVLHNLTEEDLQNLLTSEELEQMKMGKFTLPSPSTLHHFVTYRLGEKGIDFIMKCNGTAMMHYLKTNHSNSDGDSGIVDSTPVEGSRYSPYAVFNPHYKIHMAKAHIISTAGYPLYLIFSEGNENDEEYGQELIEVVKEMNPEFKEVLCDGGYDSFMMHAEIFGELGAKPVIAIREDAVLHKEATESKIYKAVNAQWKNGGDCSAPIQEQLKFLYDLDASGYKNPDKYKEMVGKYLRDQNLLNVTEIEEKLAKRGRCEEMHTQLKEAFKFNLKGCRKKHRALYLKLDFIAAQFMLIAYLQNDSSNKALAGYL